MKDYYKLLNIDYISSTEEIKRAYRKLAIKYHPDKNQGDKMFEEKFKEITEAYEVLNEPAKRREYDAQYKQYYNRETRNKSAQNEEVTPSTFLSIFVDIKNKISLNIDAINKQGLYSTLDEILSDINIKFLVTRNEVNINSQIIDNVLFCCLFLNASNSLAIRAKLFVLANNNQHLNQKISNYNSNSNNNNSNSQRTSSNNNNKKYVPHTTSNDSSNIGCIIFIIICVFAAIVIANGDKNKSTDYSPSSSQENGDLNNEFILDTTATQNGTTVYPESKQLSSEEMLEQEKKNLIKEGWTETEIENGQLPKCYNFIPKRGKINNKLEVSVGGGTDVAIKVMNVETERCVRYVFINSRTTYEITNIPEGIYYLKIAYGKDWYSKIENGQCVGKFLRNALYEKGSEIMDFNVQRTYEGYSIPSFQLQLDVISSNSQNTFNSQNISENEFNQ